MNIAKSFMVVCSLIALSSGKFRKIDVKRIIKKENEKATSTKFSGCSLKIFENKTNYQGFARWQYGRLNCHNVDPSSIPLAVGEKYCYKLGTEKRLSKKKFRSQPVFYPVQIISRNGSKIKLKVPVSYQCVRKLSRPRLRLNKS